VHVVFRLEIADLLVDELRLADLRAFIPIALEKGLRARCVSQEVLDQPNSLKVAG
jgi:hypothetical protein